MNKGLHNFAKALGDSIAAHLTKVLPMQAIYTHIYCIYAGIYTHIYIAYIHTHIIAYMKTIHFSCQPRMSFRCSERVYKGYRRYEVRSNHPSNSTSDLTYKFIRHKNQLKHGDQNDNCEGFETPFDQVHKCKCNALYSICMCRSIKQLGKKTACLYIASSWR